MLVWGGGGGMLAPRGAVNSVERRMPPDMSLFHDFKLKRRKVDSRGSSDGKF